MESINQSFSLFQGDCSSILSTLVNQVDMIFADPPYFLSTGKKIVWVKGGYTSFDKGDWDRVRSSKEKDSFNLSWLTEAKRLLKNDGTIWVCGTYHNIFSVAKCLDELGFKILNIVVWNKTDPPTTYANDRLNFSAEYIIWARKCEKSKHYFNYDSMKAMNGGRHMPDVWRIPSVSLWEKKFGKHPTQKPLHLLYRIIIASTHEGDTILDPFAGSCTTGIAANLLGRNFVGIDQSQEFLDLGMRRRIELNDPSKAEKLLRKMKENPDETMVLVNHARRDLKQKMIDEGICYLRAGDSQGSLEVTPGFERMHYVLLHTGGENARLFPLRKPGTFQIWTRETLKQHGFQPEHALYYVVLLFNNSKEIPLCKEINVAQRLNTYRAKIRPLSDFLGI